jgi:uncharacterized membrane protein
MCDVDKVIDKAVFLIDLNEAPHMKSVTAKENSKSGGCKLRAAGRGIISLFFVYVGIMHFVRPGKFIQITPEFLPYRRELVYISGFFEILGGAGLLVPQTRKAAGIGLIALLFAVFPANINMAVKKLDFGSIPVWVLWARLPLQFLLMLAVRAVSKK